VLGGVVALVAAGYVWVYHEGIHLVWETLPDELGVEPYTWWLILLTTTLGGAAVGVLLRAIPGRGGPSPVAGHALGGSADPRVAPAAAVVTIVSLVAGASLGPEAALITLASAIGVLLASRLGLGEQPTRILSTAGTSGVLGSFFSSPLVSALLALEMVTVTGPMLYALLMPGLVAAVVGVEVFQWLLDEPLFHYELPTVEKVRIVYLLYAAAIGVGGAIVGRVFLALLRTTHARVDRAVTSRPVALATIGGLLVGLLGLGGDHLTLFSGESTLQTLIDDRGSLGLAVLVYILLAKIAATAISMTTGFRGGQIFPVVFIGAAFGVAVGEVVSAVPDGVAIASGMVAAAVAVMRVPIAAILIVTYFVGADLVSVVVVAAVAAYITSFDLPLLPGHDDEVVEGPEPSARSAPEPARPAGGSGEVERDALGER
jgi:H+/Cl- antiporter ClcA